MRRVRDNKLTDVSILQIFGNESSGKSTFMDILMNLNPGIYVDLSSCFTVSQCYQSTAKVAYADIETYEKYSNRSEFIIDYYPSIIRLVFGRLESNETPKTLILETRECYEIETSKSEKRIPMHLHFPNEFNTIENPECDLDQRFNTHLNQSAFTEHCLQEFDDWIEKREKARICIYVLCMIRRRGGGYFRIMPKDVFDIIIEILWEQQYEIPAFPYDVVENLQKLDEEW